MKNKERVKVYVRDMSNLRGFLSGVIESFDKHFNLILRNAQESILESKNKTQIPSNRRVCVVKKFPLVYVKGDSVVLVHSAQ